ncbi:MAG TPA: riboflavin synthase [Gemmatimonadaceae bacterium]|jgi:riboflavin synthase|nr:riboflavin synthase [Gemmatimonadaceae bacterium]
MFTGLIEDVGVIEEARDSAAGRELRVKSAFRGLAEGESIAINGVCLTVRSHGDGWFTVAAVLTTLDRTDISSWGEGTRVNLERAMRADARLGGHIVQGHVDGVGTVDSTATAGDARLVNVRIPRELADLMVPHGSIAVNGVSLTVNELPEAGIVQLSLIEYTLAHTTLGELREGSRVHIEADVIGKYVRHLLAPYMAQV